MIKAIRIKIEQALGRGPLPALSARVAVPWIMRRFAPGSVVDVGCGNGTWLKEFDDFKVATTGMDRQKPLEFQGEYVEVDLEHFTEPIPDCDVALCLEVAEHLSPKAGSAIVEKLCARAPIIIWAAGIPLQGGIGHINEQWQSYWAAEFARFNRLPHEDLRLFLWDKEVSPWYPQDTLIYCKAPEAEKYRLIPCRLLDVVHPKSWTGIGPMGLRQRLVHKVRGLRGKAPRG